MLIDRHERIRLLRQVFDAAHPSSDGVNVACYCPNCAAEGKRKLKLAVRLDDGRYHCWVCGIRGGRILSLIKRHAPQQAQAALKFWVPRKIRREPRRQHDDATMLQLPDGFMLMANNLDTSVPELCGVIGYVRSRGLNERDMWRRRLGFSLDPSFVNRVIVPSFDASGRLNYYTSRAVRRSMWPRYRNAPGYKQDVIYNEIDIDWDNELLLTEGPFDVFTAYDNATCIFGNTLNEHFRLFERIVEHDTPVVLALDSNERRSTRRIASLLYSYDIDVRIMDLDGYKDMGEMPRDVYMHRRKSARRWTPTHALMRRIIDIDVTKMPPMSGTVHS